MSAMRSRRRPDTLTGGPDLRRVGVERRQQRHLLAGGVQALGHLVGDGGAVAAAGEQIGAVRLHVPEVGEVALRQRRRSRDRGASARRGRSAAGRRAAARGEPAGEGAEPDGVAVARRDREQRRPGAPRRSATRLSQRGRAEPRRAAPPAPRGRRREDRRGRDAVAAAPLQLGKEGERQQRVAAEGEEVVLGPTGFTSSTSSKQRRPRSSRCSARRRRRRGPACSVLGVGRRSRSSLPLAVSGSPGRVTQAPGTIAVGSRATCVRSAPGGRAPAWPATT